MLRASVEVNFQDAMRYEFSLCELWSITKHDLLQKKLFVDLHTHFQTVSSNNKILKLEC